MNVKTLRNSFSVKNKLYQYRAHFKEYFKINYIYT